MDNASSSSDKHRQSSPQLSRRQTPPRRPVSFELSIPTIDVPQHAASDAGGSHSHLVPRRKRVRSSVDSHASLLARNRAAGGGTSPLNPHRSRHLSASYVPRQAYSQDEEDEEDGLPAPVSNNSRPLSASSALYASGMEIFKDQRSPDPVLDAQIAELHRRARELGPAPRPSPNSATPSFSPRAVSPSSATSAPPALHYPTSPVITGRSFPPSAASPQSTYSPSPTTVSTRSNRPTKDLTSPIAIRTALVVATTDAPPVPPALSSAGRSAPSRSPTKPKQHGRNTSLISHLISDLKGKGKGKLKDLEEEDSPQDEQGMFEADQRITAIRNSLLTTTPQHQQLLQSRVNLVKTQLGRRYALTYAALQQGHDPPNPVKVLKWRKVVLDKERRRAAMQKLSLKNQGTKQRGSADLARHSASHSSVGLGLALGGLDPAAQGALANPSTDLPFDPDELSSVLLVKREWLVTAGLLEGYLKSAQANASVGQLGGRPESLTDALGRSVTSLEPQPSQDPFIEITTPTPSGGGGLFSSGIPWGAPLKKISSLPSSTLHGSRKSSRSVSHGHAPFFSTSNLLRRGSGHSAAKSSLAARPDGRSVSDSSGGTGRIGVALTGVAVSSGAVSLAGHPDARDMPPIPSAEDITPPRQDPIQHFVHQAPNPTLGKGEAEFQRSLSRGRTSAAIKEGLSSQDEHGQRQAHSRKRKVRHSLPGILDGVSVSLLPSLLDGAIHMPTGGKERRRKLEAIPSTGGKEESASGSSGQTHPAHGPNSHRHEPKPSRSHLSPYARTHASDGESGRSSLSDSALRSRVLGGAGMPITQSPAGSISALALGGGPASEADDGPASGAVGGSGVGGLIDKVKSKVAKSRVSISIPNTAAASIKEKEKEVSAAGRSASWPHPPPKPHFMISSTPEVTTSEGEDESGYGYGYSGRESLPTDSNLPSSLWRTDPHSRGMGVGGEGIATRAGRRVARGWNALTNAGVGATGKRDSRFMIGEKDGRGVRENLEDHHHHHQQSGGRPLRAGTRSDHRQRNLWMRAATEGGAVRRSRPVTLEFEEERRVRRRNEETASRELYERRSTLVTSSRRQVDGFSRVLQGGIRTIAEYAHMQNPSPSILSPSTLTSASGSNTQTPNIAGALDMAQDPLDPYMLELLVPGSASSRRGWRAVEEDFAMREQLRTRLDPYIRRQLRDFKCGPLAWKPLDGDGASGTLSKVNELLTTVDARWTKLAEDMRSLRELQTVVYADMEQAEMLLNQTAEKVDTTYPELARNAELILQLSPDYTAAQLLPDWVPQWLQDILRFISPRVQQLADWVLGLWRVINVIIVWMPNWSKVVIGWIFQMLFLSVWLTCRTAYNVLVWIFTMAPVKFTISLVADVFMGWRSEPTTRLVAAVFVLFGVLVIQNILVRYWNPSLLFFTTANTKELAVSPVY